MNLAAKLERIASRSRLVGKRARRLKKWLATYKDLVPSQDANKAD